MLWRRAGGAGLVTPPAAPPRPQRQPPPRAGASPQRRAAPPPGGPPWLPEEGITLPGAIAGYTIRGAYLDFAEKETGSIEAGKAADLVVLDRNLFEIPAAKIHEAKVLLTLLEGREVYRAQGFSGP